MEHSALNDVLILLALSFGVVVILRRFNLPPILGYLFVGVAAGPHALGWLPASDTLHVLGEIGVVFLLFTIGMEFSLRQFMSMRGPVLGVGGMQVLLSALAGWWVASMIGLPWQAALVVGGALAMSSTAIVIKQLTEQLEMQSRHGRLSLAILLFQDLAVVPFLVAIPILASPEQDYIMPLLFALAKGAGAFIFLIFVGRKLLRPLFHEIAALRSTELFTLTVLLVALAAAWVTNMLGLSLALGAFLAGMMLNETEFRHQIETEIRPFRDVLMGLFFIYVGLQVDPSALISIWPYVLWLVLGLIAGKGLLIALLTKVAGHENGVALRTGIVLAQGGEFGFAVLALALSNGVLAPENSQVILAAVVISMLITPLLIRYNGFIAKKIFAQTYLKGRLLRDQSLGDACKNLNNHIVLCGFGRIGQNLSRFITEEGFNYVALDLDPQLVKEAWEAGEPVFYGDATHIDVLESASLSRASVVVVTFDEVRAAEHTIHIIRMHYPELPVLVRTRNDTYIDRLESAGATEVVPETLEASMMMAAHLLKRLKVPSNEILSLVERARCDHYRELRSRFHGEELDMLETSDAYHLHTVVLQPGNEAIGTALRELGIENLNVTVSAIRRGEIRGEAPSGELVLNAGDAVILRGPPDQLEHAERVLLHG